jgi:hypothetical protein
MGAGESLRAAGIRAAGPALVFGNRVLFAGGKGERDNVWEIAFDPYSLRVRGAPRQLTFGTENGSPNSISSSGVLALNILRRSTDLYLTPLAPETGQPIGVTRRLTHDGRYKTLTGAGGLAGATYFVLQDRVTQTWSAYALDLGSGNQSLVLAGVPTRADAVISSDGSQVAYSVPEGDLYSIRAGEAGAAPGAARTLCRGCGWAMRFSRDGRFLFYQPEFRVKPSGRKSTVRLLEVATGKDRPWLEHPTDSITGIGTFGVGSTWVTVRIRPVGAQSGGRTYILPWREEPVPQPDWIEVKVPSDSSHYTPYGNFFQFFQGNKLMTVRFDPKTRTVSEPFEVKYVPGTAETVKPDDAWGIRGPGLVFGRLERTSSVWLMKLPE